ncbi:MAG: histidinol dehydrogenase [Clostridia bacterium]|nr:histidinol dehydrogenase [Clostridia bacterium]
MIKIMKMSEVPAAEIFARSTAARDVSGIVRDIIKDVRERGDEALMEYTKKFDGAELESLQVKPEEFEEAERMLREAGSRLPEILAAAADNIRSFHSMQRRDGFRIVNAQGAVVGQRIVPVAKAGLYVPGGTAAYPSTVLMDSIPAKIAGCEEVVIVTPPGRDGKINPAILMAAKTAGVDRIFKVGGAQAIAALAYGTQTIPKVDKIVGPGNAFVAEAKKQVFGQVSIDMIAGPSEILIVADGKSRADWVAADMLSQAEHDKMASAVLVTDSEKLAYEVSAELEKQIPELLRKDIARSSVDENGKIIIAGDIAEAIDVANEIAPEHIELCVDDPFACLEKIRCAGSVFLGRYCPEALGDYYAGPNHTLPTGGTARFCGALSVDDFVKKIQYIYYDEASMLRCASDVDYFAKAEGLTGHGRSVTIRSER